MADIKRANKMWTNDSLYLRSYVLLPMGTEFQPNGFANKIDTEMGIQKDLEVVTRQDLSANKVPKSESCSGSLSSVCDCSSPSESTNFLSKFDSNLAKIKFSLEKIEQNSRVPEDPSNPLHMLPKKKTQYSSSSRPRGGSYDSNMKRYSDDEALEPDLVIISRNGNNSQIQTSLDQLQKTDEEMFQL